MLIEFSVENYLSFGDRVTLSMVPYGGYIKTDGDRNTSPTGGERTTRLLNSAVMYGPNASGKTNLIKAMSFLKKFVTSPYSPDFLAKNLKPFGFWKEQDEERPSVFEVKFFLESTIYSYEIAITKKEVVRETLMKMEDKPKKRWALLFDRSKEWKGGIKFGPGFTGAKSSIYEKTREDRCFLNSLFEWNNSEAKIIAKWFIADLICVPDVSTIDNLLQWSSEQIMYSGKYADKIQAIAKCADVGINSLKAEDSLLAHFQLDLIKGLAGFSSSQPPSKLFNDNNRIRLIYEHYSQNEKGEKALLEIEQQDESEGTKNFIAYIGTFVEALDCGYTIIIDELTNSLHPLLSRAIIELFHNPAINRHGAQLIFNTHDISFINPKPFSDLNQDKNLFRRDQIWFTEKQIDGSTDLIHLIEFQEISERSIDIRYLLGAYGAVPIINPYSFEDIFQEKAHEK